MDILASKCDNCGKTILQEHSDSCDMVRVVGELSYLCDLLPDEKCRPSLLFNNDFNSYLPNHQGGHLYCPDCLLEVITRWVKEIKSRPASKIPDEDIIPPPCLGNTRGR